MKREKYLMVKVSDEEKEAAENLAKASGRTVSNFIRRLISLEVDKHILLKDSATNN
jgi:hypothetical protein